MIKSKTQMDRTFRHPILNLALATVLTIGGLPSTAHALRTLSLKESQVGLEELGQGLPTTLGEATAGTAPQVLTEAPANLLDSPAVLVVLAGGRGTRMGTDVPKPLVKAHGKPMIRFAMDSARSLGIPVVVVVGSQAQPLVEALGPGVVVIRDSGPIPLGTAAALLAAEAVLATYRGTILVTMADMPWLEPRMFQQLLETHLASGAQATYLTARVSSPSSARILRLADGQFVGEIQVGDLGRLLARDEAVILPDGTSVAAQNLVESREVGTGTYAFDAERLFSALRQVRNDNPKGEFYLPSVLAVLKAQGSQVTTETIVDDSVMSVDTPAAVVNVETQLARRTLARPAESWSTSDWIAALDRAVHLVGGPQIQQGSFNDRVTMEQWFQTHPSHQGPWHQLGFSVVRELADIYGYDTAVLAIQARRYLEAVRAFEAQYGVGSIRLIRSPGRGILMGSHNDYNWGAELLVTLPVDTLAVVRPRSDTQVRLLSTDPRFPPREFDMARELPSDRRGDWDRILYETGVPPFDWANYIKGSVLYWQNAYPAESLHGMDLMVDSTLPLERGISSSSALVVIAGIAIHVVNGKAVDPQRLAEVCCFAEWYVGTRGGGLDHAVSIMGRHGHALRLLPDSSRVDAIPLPAGYHFVMADTLVPADKTGRVRNAFNQRSAETRLLGLALLKARFPQHAERIQYLRDVTASNLRISDAQIDAMIEQLPQTITTEELRREIPEAIQALAQSYQGLPEPAGGWRIRQRVRHIVHELRRVDQATQALQRTDMAAFGKLMGEAFSSYRDDYELVVPEMEELIGLAREIPGVLGANMQGGGFGGFTIILVSDDGLGPLVETLLNGYYKPRGLSRDVVLGQSLFVATPTRGAGLVAPQTAWAAGGLEALPLPADEESLWAHAHQLFTQRLADLSPAASPRRDDGTLTILVTGGAGFIGSRFVQAALKDPDRLLAAHQARDLKIIVVDNVSTGTWENLPDAQAPMAVSKRVQQDLRDRQGLLQVFEEVRPDMVVHFAAQPSVAYSTQHPEEDYTVNVEGALNVLEASLRAGVRKLITISNAAVFGVPEALPVAETHPLRPISPNGAHKALGEFLVRLAQADFSLSYTILRFPSVYGEGQVTHAVPALVQRILKGDPVRIYQSSETIPEARDGTLREYLHVDDAVAAVLLAAMGHGENDAFNIGTGHGIRTRRLVELIGRVAQKEATIEVLPAQPGDIPAMVYDVRKAEQSMGFVAKISLEEGIARVIARHRQSAAGLERPLWPDETLLTLANIEPLLIFQAEGGYGDVAYLIKLVDSFNAHGVVPIVAAVGPSDKQASALEKLRQLGQDIPVHYTLWREQSGQLVDAHGQLISGHRTRRPVLIQHFSLVNPGWPADTADRLVPKLFQPLYQPELQNQFLLIGYHELGSVFGGYLYPEQGEYVNLYFTPPREPGLHEPNPVYTGHLFDRHLRRVIEALQPMSRRERRWRALKELGISDTLAEVAASKGAWAVFYTSQGGSPRQLSALISALDRAEPGGAVVFTFFGENPRLSYYPGHYWHPHRELVDLVAQDSRVSFSDLSGRFGTQEREEAPILVVNLAPTSLGMLRWLVGASDLTLAPGYNSLAEVIAMAASGVGPKVVLPFPVFEAQWRALGQALDAIRARQGLGIMDQFHYLRHGGDERLDELREDTVANLAKLVQDHETQRQFQETFGRLALLAWQRSGDPLDGNAGNRLMDLLAQTDRGESVKRWIPTSGHSVDDLRSFQRRMAASLQSGEDAFSLREGFSQAGLEETRASAAAAIQAISGLWALHETDSPTVFLFEGESMSWAPLVAATGAWVGVLVETDAAASGLEGLFRASRIPPERYAVIATHGDRDAALRRLNQRFPTPVTLIPVPEADPELIESFLRQHGVVFFTHVTSGLEQVQRYLDVLA